MKDEALSPVGFLMEDLPIAPPDDATRHAADSAVRRLLEIAANTQQAQRLILDWLRVEYGVENPSNKLQRLADLDSDTLVAEVRRLRGRRAPLTAAGVQGLRAEYLRTLEPARNLSTEASQLERNLSHLVNQAYRLSPDEIALLWRTAPPRMPLPRPTLPAAATG